MGKQRINSITCCKCGKDFDVNTEDIDWTNLHDMGECEAEPGTKQEGLLQEVTCPLCGNANNIAFERHVLSTGETSYINVRSLEP